MYKLNLYNARCEAGVSQQRLAEMLQVTQQSVSAWENGLASPRLPTLINLADALGVTVSELLGEAPIECAGKLQASAETGLAQSGQAEEIAQKPPDNAPKPGRFDHIDFAKRAAEALEEEARRKAWLKEHPAPDDYPDESDWISDDDDDWAKEDDDD